MALPELLLLLRLFPRFPASGTIDPGGSDIRGSPTVVNPLPSGVEAKAFAITVEPEAGSAVPTTQPIMLGAGE